jgi:Xaa-Pro aminopeptidase
MDLHAVPTAALRARRRKLAALLGEQPALVCAGRATPRNYAANTHPYRANSHFLYFVGLPLEQGALLVEGEQATLFLPRPDPADELWHGPVPSFEALAEATGCDVRAADELEAALAGRAIATVPSVELSTRLDQERWLGRSLARPTEGDARLLDAIVALRLVHDDAALAEIRAAASATADGHRAAMSLTRPGLTEHEVRAIFDATFYARGMAGHAYSPIVTVHGEVLHSHSHRHALRDGDLLLADVGAESPGGWASDVTRTWPAGGRFSSTQRDVYEVVLAAQRAAIALCRPGTRYRDVHLAASRTLAEGLIGLGILRGDPDELVADGVHALLFPHGIGHLLGLDVHDMEDLGDRAGYAPGRTRSPQFGLAYLRLDRDLAPRMVVTIEPGFYQVPAILADPRLEALASDRLDRARLAKFADVRGIRIEDDVLVTDDEPEVLTADIPKDAAEVEQTVYPR